jgi:periplasmic divalent cation tolerance protein
MATRLAEALVSERLAACATLLPGARSVYRWQGRVESAEEVQLVIKSTHERLEALTRRIVELHPHELPEVIAVEVAGGLVTYLEWIDEQTRVEGDR